MADIEYQYAPTNLADVIRDADDRKRAASLRVWGDSVFHASPGLEIKRNVIDPSGGALLTGGSSWAPGMPLVASNSGLSEACVIVPLTKEEEMEAALHGFSTSFEVTPMTTGKPRPMMKRGPRADGRRRKVRFPKQPQQVAGLQGLADGTASMDMTKIWLGLGCLAAAGALFGYCLAKQR